MHPSGSQATKGGVTVFEKRRNWFLKLGSQSRSTERETGKPHRYNTSTQRTPRTRLTRIPTSNKPKWSPAVCHGRTVRTRYKALLVHGRIHVVITGRTNLRVEQSERITRILVHWLICSEFACTQLYAQRISGLRVWHVQTTGENANPRPEFQKTTSNLFPGAAPL